MRIDAKLKPQSRALHHGPLIPARVYCEGDISDLQRSYPRPGLDPDSPGHFDFIVPTERYTMQAMHYFRFVGDCGRFLFELRTETKPDRRIARILSTLPALFDALPSASFFILSNSHLHIPDRLRRRVTFLAKSEKDHESSLTAKPEFAGSSVHPLLCPEVTIGTLTVGYRYSGALVSAMRSLERLRQLEGQ